MRSVTYDLLITDKSLLHLMMTVYTRTYPDKSCHRVAEVNSAELVSTFVEAQAKCRAEGARLYQPRNKERAPHFVVIPGMGKFL